jgi:hypothetical protein
MQLTEHNFAVTMNVKFWHQLKTEAKKMTWNFQEMNIGYINREMIYSDRNFHYCISTDCNTFAAANNSVASHSSAREATTHKMKMVRNEYRPPFSLVQVSVGRPCPRHEGI